MDRTTRETSYTRKSSALRAMWAEYYRQPGTAGMPLVGDDGETLQWTSEQGTTRRICVTRDGRYEGWLVIRSWL